MSRSSRLRFSLLLVALLPGLLFQSGESLRVCLHDWIDFQDGCQETAALDVPPAAPGGSCCTDDRTGPEEPDRAEPRECGACGGCCIEIGVDRAELSTTPPAVEGPFLDLALPVHHVAARFPAAALRPLKPRTLALANPPPGRAPTPLRI